METVLNYYNRGFIISIGIILSLLISYSTVTIGFIAPIISLFLGVFFVFLIIVFKNPLIGLMTLIVYCFIFMSIERELDLDIPLSYLVEIICIITWIGVIVKSSKHDWRRINNDLSLVFLIWFLISVLELINPEGANPRGWLNEIRTSGLDSFLLVPIGFMIFQNKKHLNLFLYLIIGFSFLAILNGLKQLYFGMFPGEHEFVMNSPTHLIWGKLRVFSIYKDAGQFGASQAQLAIICGVLAIGPFKTWKRVSLVLLALLFFYGMLISGTRGALFVLIPGLFLAAFLFKNLKVLFYGTMALLLFLAVLKYTHVGSGNYQVYRLRSALNPDDASLGVRFINQQIIHEYMKSRPFGAGLGVIGYAGGKYNSDKFISTIAPHSYWVKVWVMYGIIGFVFWFCMMMYILGKCCGIVWNIKDERLRVKLIALTSGFCGILACSYGNEVINSLPSSIIVYLSLVLVYLGPEFDRQTKEDKLVNF